MKNINLESIEANGYLDSMVEITSGRNMITDGPLSLQYTKALNEIYKKQIDPSTGISLETQVNDAIISKSLWIASDQQRDELNKTGHEIGMLYGVKQSDLGMTNVIEVTDALGQMNDNDRENSAIIIEIQKPTQVEGVNLIDNSYVSSFESIIKEIALENNVDVYHSLEEFVESNKMPDGVYSGTISGKKVKFKIGKKTHKFTNDKGVTGKDIPCEIVVKKNDVYQINVSKQK